jgi:Stress responsive A/B Barrel Domain
MRTHLRGASASSFPVHGIAMIKHVVVWKLKDPARRNGHSAAVKSALEDLRGRIPGLLAIEVGADIGYDSDAADLCLYAEFADRAALDHYQNHPLHVVAKAVVGAHVTDRRAVDWEA